MMKIFTLVFTMFLFLPLSNSTDKVQYPTKSSVENKFIPTPCYDEFEKDMKLKLKSFALENSENFSQERFIISLSKLVQSLQINLKSFHTCCQC